MSPGLWLAEHGGGPPEFFYRLGVGVHVLGRSAACDLVISHPSISSKHAEIKLCRRQARVRDLDSDSGTFLNGERITSRRLHGGDLLALGPVLLDVLDEGRLTALLEATAQHAAGEEISSREHLMIVQARLTPSQQNVLKLLLLGLAEKEIAAKLRVSFETAHTHIKHIYQQVGVHARSELMALYVTSGSDDPTESE